MTTGKFISSLLRSNGRAVSVKVAAAGMQDAIFWDQAIQIPWIDATPRIDAGWRWQKLYRRCLAFELFAVRKLAYLQVLTAGSGGSAFPLGQLLLSDGYPYPPSRQKPCIFLWYLAGAPGEAVEAAGAQRVQGILDAMVDTAIQFSYMQGYEGRLCLHASPAGDPAQRNKLMERYRQVGLKLWKRNAFVGWFRRNDGRYFLADESIASTIAKRLDTCR